MTTSWTEKEKTWSVLLYRRETDHWKKQELQLASSSSLSTMLSSRKKNLYQHITTVVAPRKECIVFPALRQRFSLKSQTDQGTVIRRNDKILLKSRRRARSLLLQFHSLEDCLAFSDHFFRMNPNISTLSPADEKVDISSTSNESSLQEITPQQENRAGKFPIVREDERKEVVSHVTRLLHDEDFLSMIHKIETHISNTNDGAQILRGLENRQLHMI